MTDNTFLRKDDDAGYIIGWRYKYEFKSGKYADKVMTYGEALKRAQELCAEKTEMAFYPVRADRTQSKFDAQSMGEATH